MPPLNILIIGGGISGFAVALSLRLKQHSVTLLEKSPGLQTQGGSLLIPPNAAKVVDRYGCGLLHRYAELEEQAARHEVWASEGRLLDVIDHEKIGRLYGFGMYNVTRKAQQKIFYEAAVAAGANVRFGCAVREIDESAPSVTLRSGEKIEADVIIGADGLRSIVRTAVLGKEIDPIPESLGLQCVIDAEKIRKNPLTADMVDDRAMKSWWGPNRHIISGPKAHRTKFSLSLFLHGPALASLPSKYNIDISVTNRSPERHGDLAILHQNAHVFEPRVRALLDMVEQKDCSLWYVSYLPDLETWVSPSGCVTIMGDAAHAMTPHLGQGAATCIEDSACLAECLSSSLDVPAALHLYEKLRKSRAEKIKRTAQVSGDYKILEEGEARKRRDEGFAKRLDSNAEGYDEYRSYAHLKWLYGYDVVEETRKAIEKLDSRARL